MCYDESEDDPWVYAYSPSKDYLSEGMIKARALCGQHVLDEFHTGAWANHVAIDPCISILPTTKAQSDDQKVAAMGVKKMMSPKSKYKGGNCRAPSTTKSQGKKTSRYIGRPSLPSARSGMEEYAAGCLMSP